MAPARLRPHHPSVRVLAAVGGCALALVGAGCESGDDETSTTTAEAPSLAKRPPAAKDAPNVVVIMADDQSSASFTPRFMPETFKDIVEPGTRLATGLAAPPLCCPARAGFLTGQYPHNHGVFSNHKGYLQLRDPEQVLPAWLQLAGYETGFVGKPLNGYNRLGRAEAAPGFDQWFANFGGRAAYYDYDLSINGDVRHYGTDPSDYMTDVLSGHALDFVSEASKGDRPFFLWLAQYAPHRHAPPPEVAKRIPSCSNSVPTPLDEAAYRRWATEPLPKSPSYDEADVADKQREIEHEPPIDRTEEGFIERHWHCTLAAVEQLDKTVGEMVDRLRSLGELDDTVIVYLSDNGYFFGEHRLANGKGWFYREASEVPFAIRVPPGLRDGAAPAETNEMVANIDLAPTILEWARAKPCIADDICRTPDGRSLADLLAGRESTLQGRRAVLLELASGCEAYAAIRTSRYVYSEPAGEFPEKCELGPELYDLKADPYELNSLAHDPASADLRAKLEKQLAALRDCSGTRGPSACE